MQYRNTENGRIIDVSSPITGGPWIPVSKGNTLAPEKEEAPKPKAASGTSKKGTTKKKSTKKSTTKKKGGKK